MPTHMAPSWSPPRVHSEPGGYFHGPVAHAFACGAQMAVTNEAPWNTIDRSCSCCSPKQKRAMLKESWGVESLADWHRVLENLLDDEGSDGPAELILDLRAQAARQRQGPVDPGAWRRAIRSWQEAQNAPKELYEQLVGLAGVILTYEKRMTADGALPPGGMVTAMIAYDFGRAVNMARWGVHAQFADRVTAERYIMRAGAQCLRYFASWADLSAGYILGRCLRFDDGEFGDFYTDPVAAHRALLTDPGSPWLNLPFRM
jgi:hypothetical protein